MSCGMKIFLQSANSVTVVIYVYMRDENALWGTSNRIGEVFEMSEPTFSHL